VDDAVARAVLDGLFLPRKSLPSWLLYDAAGCALYERITMLPEYYLTRAEAEIFATQGDAIIAALRADARLPVSFGELGAGTATKTESLLRAAVRAQGGCVYLACDISPDPLHIALRRLGATCPDVSVRAFVGTHLAALPELARLPGRQVVMYIGSSIGNLRDDAAAALLGALRPALRPGARLILGTDTRKDAETMRLAYDDAQGVTAAFSLNLLTRLNRELDADFDLEGFRHVARVEPGHGDVEIAIVSQRRQRVRMARLDRTVSFEPGERIETEVCAKYDRPRVDHLLGAAGFRRCETFTDAEARFDVHVAALL
jgi:dimethylhistidine N-methyltransferase